MGYYDVIRQRVELGAERITLLSKAGMVPWEEVAEATALLAESAEVQPGMRALLLEGGAGALAVWAARRGAEVHVYDGSLVAARMARLTLQANDVTGATLVDAAYPGPEVAAAFDVALLPLPKGRAYTRLLLGAAGRALKPGGRLYLAGPNAGGAKAVIRDAGAILGRAATIRTRARHRVGLAVRLGGHAVAEAETWHEFQVLGLRLFSIPGVFSREGLDDGTAMLLGTLDAALCAGKRVLDVGCGYGVLGMVAARLGAAAVDLVDVQWLAVACTAHGIAANRLGDTCRAWASDLYADVAEGPPYDLILSNPPFHAGHAVSVEAAEALMSGARDRLARGGRLRLVTNRFLPHDRALRRVFGASRVAVLAEDTRYRVIEGRR